MARWLIVKWRRRRFLDVTNEGISDGARFARS
jgi:hypothetical protein